MENNQDVATEIVTEQQMEITDGDIHRNPVGEEGTAVREAASDTSAGDSAASEPPQAAAPTGAAVGAERPDGADAPPAAAEAQTLLRAVAEWMQAGGGTEREATLFRLQSELEKERRLRRLSENKLTCLGALETAEIPATFAELLVTEDGAETEARTAAFIAAAREWINREISRKLETLTPRIGGGRTGITTAQFRAMRIAEQQELFRTNRPLYEELSRQGKKG